MRKVIGMLVVMVVVSAVAFADVLPPNLIPPVAGETDIVDDPPPPAGIPGSVDWIVLPPGDYTGTPYQPFVLGAAGTTTPTEYIYLYQVEGRADANVSFTLYVTGPWSNAGNFVTALDLDDVHDPSVDALPPSGADFPYLSGEFEPSSPGALVQPYIFDASTPGLFQWQWSVSPYGKLNENDESYVLFIVSPAPPIYGYATLKDTLTGQSYKVPVPSPEPTTLALLMMGILLGGVISRRKK